MQPAPAAQLAICVMFFFWKFFCDVEQLPYGGGDVPSHVCSRPYAGRPRISADGGVPAAAATSRMRVRPSSGELGPAIVAPEPGAAPSHVMS